MERRYLTHGDRRLLREVLAAVTATTAPLPPDQAAAVDHARHAAAGVETGDVTVTPPPATTSTTSTTSTTLPPTTVTTQLPMLTIPAPPPTATIPPPFMVTVP